MKLPGHSLLVVATLALTALARAATFDFAYTFGDGTLVTGRFDGVQNGSYAADIAHVQLAINGTAVTGNLFAATFDGSDYVNGAVISFDGALNNVLFVNSDYVGGDYGYDSYFLMRVPEFGDIAAAYSFPAGADALIAPTEAVNASAWSLSVNAPDSAPTAALLGLATLGLLTLRRRSLRS
ncbi:MAG: hypothetical protein NTV51_15580 [Verrucomicrobia bacterium]|nr:hypothetical protein [Verrucomicrobiota bacterium]